MTSTPRPPNQPPVLERGMVLRGLGYVGRRGSVEGATLRPVVIEPRVTADREAAGKSGKHAELARGFSLMAGRNRQGVQWGRPRLGMFETRVEGVARPACLYR